MAKYSLYGFPDAKVVWDYHTRRKMELYAQHAEGEVSGLGKVRVEENGDIYIEDIFIFEQESSHSGTEADPEAYAQWLDTEIAEGRDPSVYKLWWHSHADMGAFHSSTDDQQMRDFRLDQVGDFMVSIVTNKKGSFHCELWRYYGDMAIGDSDAKLVTLYPTVNEEELSAQVEAEVKEKVKRPKATTYTTSKGGTGIGFGGYGQGWGDGEWSHEDKELYGQWASEWERRRKEREEEDTKALPPGRNGWRDLDLMDHASYTAAELLELIETAQQDGHDKLTEHDWWALLSYLCDIEDDKLSDDARKLRDSMEEALDRDEMPEEFCAHCKLAIEYEEATKLWFHCSTGQMTCSGGGTFAGPVQVSSG